MKRATASVMWSKHVVVISINGRCNSATVQWNLLIGFVREGSSDPFDFQYCLAKPSAVGIMVMVQGRLVTPEYQVSISA